MSWSTSRTDQLGDRLRNSDVAYDDDLAKYEQMVQDRYTEVVQVVIDCLEGAGFEFTTRFPKTSGTLIDKLKRYDTKLSAIEDIAGARIVANGGRLGQDDVVTRLVDALGGTAECTVKDRRADPSHGYRAVHVIADVKGTLVEIQVRTQLQDQWANLMEKFADTFGRQVRYGAPPHAADEPILPTHEEVTPGLLYRDLLDQSERLDKIESLEALLSQPTLDVDEAKEAELEYLGIENLDELGDVSTTAFIMRRAEDDLSEAMQSQDEWVENFAKLLTLVEQSRSA